MYIRPGKKCKKQDWGTCDDSVHDGKVWPPWSACRHGSCSYCRASSPGQSLSSMSSLGSTDVQPFVHTAQNQCRKLETNIPRKGIAWPQSQFPHSYVCKRFIYSHHRSAYSQFCCKNVLYVDRSWEYINHSQTHECGNWDWGRALPRKGTQNWYFRCSAPVVWIPDILRRIQTQIGILGLRLRIRILFFSSVSFKMTTKNNYFCFLIIYCWHIYNKSLRSHTKKLKSKFFWSLLLVAGRIRIRIQIRIRWK